MTVPATRSEVAAGPQTGELIPPFTLRSTAGRTVVRHEYKGRRHLVLFFVHDSECPQCREMLDILGEQYQAYRAEGAEVLAFLPAGPDAAPPELDLPYPLLCDDGGVVRERYGARGASGEPLPALFVADRYGEIVLRAVATDAGAPVATAHGLPYGEVQPTLELLQVQCSL